MAIFGYWCEDSKVKLSDDGTVNEYGSWGVEGDEGSRGVAASLGGSGCCLVISGDAVRSRLSASSSPSGRVARPFSLSVAHRRIRHPSPSQRPISSLSRKESRSSIQSW